MTRILKATGLITNNMGMVLKSGLTGLNTMACIQMGLSVAKEFLLEVMEALFMENSCLTL